MSQRRTISGRRSGLVWLSTLFALALIAIIVVVVFLVAPNRRRQQQLEAHYKACVAFQSADDWDKAVEECAQAVAINAGYEDARARYAEARAKQHEVLATAQAKTAQATAIAAAEAESTAATATVQARMAQATSAAATATVQAKTTAQAQETRATATAEALARLEGHYQKGMGYINRQKWVEAEAELEQVFEEDPNYKDVQAKLAEVETEVSKLIPTATPTSDNTPIPSPTSLTWKGVNVTPQRLPGQSGAKMIYSIPEVVPSTVREVLIYVWVRTGGKNSDGDSNFKFTINAGSDAPYFLLHLHGYNQDAWSYNSDNVWLPMPADRQIQVELLGESINGNWSGEIRVIGYR